VQRAFKVILGRLVPLVLLVRMALLGHKVKPAKLARLVSLARQVFRDPSVLRVQPVLQDQAGRLGTQAQQA
jgi:hypothetical protein